jgi:hypothetical protein
MLITWRCSEFIVTRMKKKYVVPMSELPIKCILLYNYCAIIISRFLLLYLLLYFIFITAWNISWKLRIIHVRFLHNKISKSNRFSVSEKWKVENTKYINVVLWRHFHPKLVNQRDSARRPFNESSVNQAAIKLFSHAVIHQVWHLDVLSLFFIFMQ